MGQGAFAAVLHCFTSSRALAETGLELGLYVSFSGVLTFKNSRRSGTSRATCRWIALLVETDAPYLAPTPHRGRRNEPAFVVETAKALAEVKGVDPRGDRRRDAREHAKIVLEAAGEGSGVSLRSRSSAAARPAACRA